MPFGASFLALPTILNCSKQCVCSIWTLWIWRICITFRNFFTSIPFFCPRNMLQYLVWNLTNLPHYLQKCLYSVNNIFVQRLHKSSLKELHRLRLKHSRMLVYFGLKIFSWNISIILNYQHFRKFLTNPLKFGYALLLSLAKAETAYGTKWPLHGSSAYLSFCLSIFFLPFTVF